MIYTIAQLIAWLNGVMNALFALLRAPMQALPPWLSLTVISAFLGMVLLVLFKYTSPQAAIGRTRDRIKANLLAMKLFRDSVPAVLRAQGRVFLSAFMLLICSIPPLLVMILPFSLVMGQLGVWYQFAPLQPHDEAVIEMRLSDAARLPLSQVSLLPTEAVRVATGPVRIPSQNRIIWKVEAMQPGTHELRFDVGGQQVVKSLSVGSGLVPVSAKRPSMRIGDLILYPAEKPFSDASPVQSIAIEYPGRTASITGSGNWVITLLVISMLAALAVKPAFNVKL